MTAAGIYLEAPSPPVLAATAGSEEVRASPYGGKDDGRDSSPPVLADVATGTKGQPEVIMSPEERSTENSSHDPPPEVNVVVVDVSREARLVPPGADGLEAQTCDAMVKE